MFTNEELKNILTLINQVNIKASDSIVVAELIKKIQSEMSKQESEPISIEEVSTTE